MEIYIQMGICSLGCDKKCEGENIPNFPAGLRVWGDEEMVPKTPVGYHQAPKHAAPLGVGEL